MIERRSGSRLAPLLSGVALIGGIALGVAPAAQEPAQPGTVTAYAMTPERVAASGGVVVGLIGVVVGALALVRAKRGIGLGSVRRSAVTALVLAPIGLIAGGLVVATADGGLGTGNGLAGGVVAMMVGVVGTILGGLGFARSRRTV